MKRTLILVMALASTVAFAQDDSNDAPRASNGSVADAGSFGLRIGSSFITPTGTGVGMVEGRYFLSNDLALDLGLGLNLTVAGGASVGFGVGGGISYFLGGHGNFRPFIVGGLGIGLVPGAAGTSAVGLSFNAGAGGEYWFSPHFSVAGRALLVVVPQFNVATTIAILSPGVSMTWYFN